MAETITIAPRRQQQIDRYCALSGISKEKAINEMWDLWETFIYLPRTDFMEREERQRKAWEAIRRQREKAERGETPNLTMDEIIAEIKLARAERHANQSTQ